MADSDDEYDRRRRDKFRKERSDYQERRDERGRREEWVDSRRDSWSRDRNRRDYRDYDPRRRDRYSPPRHDLSPPMKRMRRGDWDDRNSYPTYDIGYGGGAMVGSHQNWGPPHDLGGSAHGQHGYGGPGSGQRNEQDIGPTQPPVMTFKQFLTSQDDTISDEEAVKKYNEYKLEFRRQQLNEFFLTHKEEEWFKSKYHPEECGRRQAEQLLGLKKRLEVFMELVDNSRIDGVNIDSEKAEEIVKLLDAVVIKLEGGTDLDLRILDQVLEELEKGDKSEPYILDKKEEPEKKKEKVEKEKTKDPSKLTISAEQKELQRKAKEFLKKTGEGKDAVEKNEKKDKKRKRNKEYNYDEIEDSGSDSESGSEAGDPEEKADDDEPPPPGLEENNASDDAVKAEPAEVEKEVQQTEEERKDIKSPTPDAAEKLSTSPPPGESVKPEDEEDAKSNERPAEPENEEPDELKPRPLHKTCSIFLRNLAPSITKQEVEAMCKRYPGFLRVAIADPQPERRFFRRGWVTFERGVNIKEICWNLNNIRLRDCELGAIVNRDLTRRIRSVNGITSHKQVVRADIKLAAKIIQNLDSRHELWTDDQETADGSIPSFGLISKNPLLKNITDYLIEEASAEEEELLGTSNQEEKTKESDGSETTVERDETLIKVIDRLVLYLRIVHSVDYYNHSDYPNEDEMPNRCGILHARGPPPTNKVTQNEVSDYINNFEQKINPFLQPLVKLSSEESTKLGKKDPDAEVEKFIVANTQELAKDKWLCPLSGKKFKGPEFVRKHIFNKHGEKIEEVKKEVEYFNNYLTDPKRPQLPEHPGSKGPNNNMHMGGNRGDGFGMPQQGYMPAPQYGYAGYGQTSRGAGPGLYTANYGGRGDNFRSGGYYSKRGRGPPQRELIQYRDLDAPNDVDIF